MKQRAYTRELREPRPGEIEAFLSRKARKLEPQANGELRFSPCPACNNVKRSGGQRLATCADVNLKSGLWRCWACGVRGNWLTLTRAFGDELPRSDRYKDQRPEDLWKLRDYFSGQSRRPVVGGHHAALLAYCRDRGFFDETLERFRVSTCGPDTLRFPLYAWEGGRWVMANAKLKKCLQVKEGESRSRFEKAGGPTGLAIGQHLLSATNGERVFVWEGEMDAMTADQIGLKNSISVPNGADAVHVDGILRYVPEDWPVYLGMDMDPAGDRAVERFFAQLDPRRIVRIVLPENPKAEPGADGKRPPFKDLNEWFVALDGGLTGEEVMRCGVGIGVAKAEAAPPPVSFGEIQRKLASQTGEASKVRRVCSLPWPALTDIFKGGLLSKQTTGFLAPSGIGKSTAVNQMAIHAAGEACKTGLISLEDPREDLYENLNQAAMGWLSIEGLTLCADSLIVSPLEGSAISAEHLVAECERLCDLGCRLIVVDNIDHMVDRGDINRGSAQKLMIYAALIELAKRRDCHVIVVWQCNKVDRAIRVNSGNQKGYGQTFLDSSNYMNMNRIIDRGEEVSEIEVEKARAAGTSFVKCRVRLTYVEAKRCFFQVDGNVVSMQSANGGGVVPF